ncbi:glycoside hydrolase family 43 protein [Mycetocola zhadangensis]|uniref:glycoside hydrolase family 43 protein n=1 Tax=Mycetocola zhadangensis TaxID=1164595 RepID=UPI001996DA40|nr:glycoside hydrolase family 43 protein [Mycetocola zhadangensis]GGF00963.1 glycoside hydrolase [Mycetocola zhadangensis]
MPLEWLRGASSTRFAEPRGNAGRHLLAAVAVVLTGTLVLSGCSTGDTSDGETSEAASPAAFVIAQHFPDPDVLKIGDTYYAYATNSLTANVQFATSDDLETWEIADEDAFPELPAWAEEGRTWAPDVAELADGRFALYFTAQDAASSKQCIGAATADAPIGPFVATSDTPLICPLDEGGAIDAASFTDADGSRYLVWKNDGNCCALDTWLQLSPLGPDGVSLAGEPVRLLSQTEEWEGSLIEAPVIVTHDDSYVLFYSANDYGGYSYATGYATAPALTGPYTKADGPLLTSALTDEAYIGPGGQDIISGPDGSDRIVFHSWDPAIAYRGMNVLPLSWDDSTPVVKLP